MVIITKKVKIIFYIFSASLLSILLFAFIASFSFESMYYNKDDDTLIRLNKEDGSSIFIYSDKDREIKGTSAIIDGKITFLVNDHKVLTATYYSNAKKLVITGKINDKNYKNKEYKQVSSFKEYLKAIF